MAWVPTRLSDSIRSQSWFLGRKNGWSSEPTRCFWGDLPRTQGEREAGKHSAFSSTWPYNLASWETSIPMKLSASVRMAILLMTVAGAGDNRRWQNQEVTAESPMPRWAGASSEGTGPTPGDMVTRDVYLWLPPLINYPLLSYQNCRLYTS